MNTIKIDYQRTVLADGDFVTSAIVSGDKLDKNNINFTVDGSNIPIRDVIAVDNKLIFNFEEIPELATIQFGSNFQDRLILPQIIVKIANNELPIQTKFLEDETIAKFKSNFFQNDDTSLAYYLYSSNKKATFRPLVIFMHGSGERGYGDRYPLYCCDIPKVIAEYTQTNEDAVILAPQATWAKELNGWFRPNVRRALMDLVHYIISSENIDPNRIYMIGLSNGGAATWHFAQQHSDLFAAIAPCCGYIYNDNKYFLTAEGKGRYMEPTEEEAKSLVHMPIWAFHASDDNVVNAYGTIHTIKMVKNAGNTTARETIYEAGKCGSNPHSSWRLMAHEPGLLPWLFSQHK